MGIVSLFKGFRAVKKFNRKRSRMEKERNDELQEEHRMRGCSRMRGKREDWGDHRL